MAPPTDDTTPDQYGKALRCPACRLTPGLCVCGTLPRLAPAVELVIVQHTNERHSQSNTGSLVHRMLEGSELVPYGARQHALDAATLWRADTSYAVLFPEPGAPVVSPAAFPPSAKRGALVVIDATWRQARRMTRRIPGLRAHPIVTVPDSERVLPPLRQPIRDGQLDTAEAVARALECLGFEDDAAELREALARVVARVLHIRGKIPRRAVAGASTTTRR